ncbi:sugar-binding protein [Paludisphaera borealis]|uniref:PDZ domain-containing protein n=1 Tax=Paludisphaera borealis TaxID=1387353 RepID=A0A1U7CIV9_9BACT|nr:sugar-binding protein [Paludisphaera borealis]APW58874.1 hypothetical protein BSF38_00282 [Paludisphaera borealis]
MTDRPSGDGLRRGSRLWATAWVVILSGMFTASAQPQPTTIGVEVDLRDLPRRLVHSTIQIPCKPGRELAIWHPKWIPGTHEPCGSIENTGGLRIQSPDGATIPWRRDELDLYRIVFKAPADVSSVRVTLDTICNQAAIEASGHLTFGNKLVGVVNWSTCVLYPEGPTAAETTVELSARLPETWKYATALKTEAVADGLIRFAPVSLVDLIDSPLIAGEHLRTIKLETGPYPPASFHLATDAPASLELNPNVIAQYSRLVREAGALFGSYHHDDFQFLVTCSDDLGYLGLEHLASSLNGVGARDLLDDHLRVGWVANLIPHEYVHSWCGKYRRPAGMCTPNFHSPMATRLLWVYEGLTQYLGDVLMVRCGLVKPEDYKRTLTGSIGDLVLQSGRRWRSLEDTAVASSILRARSPNWNELRRSQDYYSEGALLWMEIDALIRQKTDGKKSLDDFCKAFLGGPTKPEKVAPYELPEIAARLNEIAPNDWKTFLEDRVTRPLDALPVDFVARLGYRLQFGAGPSAPDHGRRRVGLSARHSLGLTFGDDGRVVDVAPGMIADRSGLSKGTKVVGINGRTFSAEALHDALTASVSDKKVDFLIVEGDRLRPLTLAYADGLRHPELVRDPSQPDLLAAILKPRDTTVETKKEEAPKTAANASPTKPQPTLPKGYVCYRADRPIAVDGKLDDPAWDAAPWTDAFVDIEGDRKPLPRFETRAKMLWDDEYFYIAARLKEPHVWGTLTQHDAVIFQDNDFEVFIDPDGDNHEYYEIEINALNTEWDLFLKKPYRDGGPAENAWEIPGLKKGVAVAGTLNKPSDVDEAWSVELAFPWKVLAEFAHRPSPPNDGDQWRVNFSRVEWLHDVVDGQYRKVPKTPEDNWVWSPQGVVDMHRPERWGFVQFSTAKPGTASFRPDPAVPVRDRLMQIYHAQSAFQRNNKAWTETLDPLDLGPLPAGMPRHTTAIRKTPEGYEAAITFEPQGQPPQTWTVRQDSRISRNP